MTENLPTKVSVYCKKRNQKKAQEKNSLNPINLYFHCEFVLAANVLNLFILFEKTRTLYGLSYRNTANGYLLRTQ